MGKKREKMAKRFIKGNTIIVRKFGDWLGCDKNMKHKDIFILLEDMVERYKEECYTNCFDVQMFGPGKKSSMFGGKGHGYRNDDFDEDWDVPKPKTKKPQTIEELMNT